MTVPRAGAGGNDMRGVKLKAIVPDLHARCKRLERAYKILFPMTLLFIPAIPAMIVMSKYGYCRQLCAIIDAVSLRNAVPLISVFGYAPNAKEAAEKLIETGNLPDHRLVAGLVLVKNGVEMTEQEAVECTAALYSPSAAAAAGLSAENMSPEMLKVAAVYAAREEAILRGAWGSRDLTAAQRLFLTPSATLPAEQPEKSADERICPSCGAACGDAKFCPECGAGLAAEEKPADEG